MPSTHLSLHIHVVFSTKHANRSLPMTGANVCMRFWAARSAPRDVCPKLSVGHPIMFICCLEYEPHIISPILCAT